MDDRSYNNNEKSKIHNDHVASVFVPDRCPTRPFTLLDDSGYATGHPVT